MNQRIRNKLGSVLVEDPTLDFDEIDNLATVIAIYFELHVDRPDDDPETENGWGEWVERKTNEALDLIAKQLNLTASAQRE